MREWENKGVGELGSERIREWENRGVRELEDRRKRC